MFRVFECSHVGGHKVRTTVRTLRTLASSQGMNMYAPRHAASMYPVMSVGRQESDRMSHDIEPSNIEPHPHHDVHAQYAGNVLVYGGISPNEGDWFGGVTADDAEQLLTALTEIEVGPRPTRAWLFLCPTGLR